MAIIVQGGGLGTDFDLQAFNRAWPRTGSIFHSAGQVGSTLLLDDGRSGRAVWYHVAGTWDASGLRMYVNGQLENTQRFYEPYARTRADNL